MSYLLLTVEQIIAVHDEVLEPNELQGMAGATLLSGGYQAVVYSPIRQTAILARRATARRSRVGARGWTLVGCR